VKSQAVFVLLCGMLLALVYLVGTRTRDPHVVPARVAEPAAPPQPNRADAGAPGGSAPAASPPVSASASGEPPPGLAPSGDARAPMLDRPLRIVSASWEIVAPALVANGGRATADGSALRSAGIDAQIEVVGDGRDVDNRLARGGADPDGADVAIEPLPVLVASYEKLRALEPRIVLVVGWSLGREVLLAAHDGALSRPAAAGTEATLASDDVAATALALFALDQAGIRAARVHVVGDPKGAAFQAVARPLPADRPDDVAGKVLLSTADASRLVPLVAVAPRAFVDSHVDALAALGRAWLKGAAQLRADVPAAARRIAAEPNAPEPATMLERLGWMQDAGAADEARALGIAGHDVVTVASLFARDWSLLRDAGTLTTPPPDPPPVATAPMSKVLPADAPGPATAPASPPAPAERVLLAHRVNRGDAAAIATDAAWLAGVFDRSTVRLSARTPALAKDAAAAAHDTYGVAAARLVVAASPTTDGSAARIEVLAAP